MDSDSDDDIFTRKIPKKLMLRAEADARKKKTAHLKKDNRNEKKSAKKTAKASSIDDESKSEVFSNLQTPGDSGNKVDGANFKRKKVSNKKKLLESTIVSSEDDVKEFVSATQIREQEQESEDTIECIFCPACQAPLHFLKISPDAHAVSCAVDSSTLPECPDGVNCVCVSIFHFRDFAHTLLAKYRSTKHYISPRVARRAQSKIKSRKTPGSLQKSSQLLSQSQKLKDISMDVGDEAKEKVKRKLYLDEPVVSRKKQNTQKPDLPSQTEKAEMNISKDKSNFGDLGCLNQDTKTSFSMERDDEFNLELNVASSSSNFNIPSARYKNQRSFKSKTPSNEDQNFKSKEEVDLMSSKHNSGVGRKKQNDAGFKSPFLNEDNCKLETEDVTSNYFVNPSFSHKDHKHLCSKIPSSNKDHNFESQGSTVKSNCKSNNSVISEKESSDNWSSSVDELKNYGFATDSQVNACSCGSRLDSQPCSTPTDSEAPDYLVRGVCTVDIKEEVVDVEQNANEEGSLFESSQNYPPEFLSHSSANRALVKEERLSPNSSAFEAPFAPESPSLLSFSTDFSERTMKSEVPSDNSLQLSISDNREGEVLVSDSFQFANGDNCEREISALNSPQFANGSNFETEVPVFDGDGREEDIPDFSSDEEFERCFEKYNQDDSCRTPQTELDFHASSDDSFVSKSASSLKKQENSKNLWKQILRSKAVSSNDSVSLSRKQKVFSKSRVIISEAEQREKNLNEPAKRTCPFYKRIPGTTFVVDAFSYGIIPGVTSYFLSHFHSDHYIGLRKSFNKPIYCSKITASLVNMKLGVKEEFLRVLDLREPRIINGVEVTTLDANHCPGAVMFLFRLLDNRQYLHVGDFRACREMESEPILRKAHITALFLDTTYCNSQYTFPLQKDVIQMVVEVVEKKLAECPNLLVVCGSYTIGKEKVFLGILDKFRDWKLWAHATKQRVLNVLENRQITSKLVDGAQEAKVHVLAMGELNFPALEKHLSKMKGKFSHILAFKPTGWEMGKGAKSAVLNFHSSRNVTIYGVPYSEHSSYNELCRFTQFIAPEKVIPTVNVGNVVMRNKMMNIINKWLQNPQSHQEQKSLKSYF